MDARVRKRLRKWRNEVLDQWQRRTEDLPVFAKGGHAAVSRGRALLYYAALVVATVYVVSILQFNLLFPSSAYYGGGSGGGGGSNGGGGWGGAAQLDDPAFTACHRGPQYLSAAVGGSVGASSSSSSSTNGGGAAYLQLLQAAAASQQVRRRAAGEAMRSAGSRRVGVGGGDEGEEEEEEESGGNDKAADDAAASALAATDKYYHFQGLYVPAVPMPEGRYAARRGIVVTASGRIAGQAVGAYVTAYILRKVLGCRLPMEVFFVGPRETFGAHLHAKLRELGDVTILSLPGVLRRDAFFQERLRHLHVADRRLRSYAAKPYAVYASSFQEVLLFDAGVMPFVDPARFFDDFAGYRDHGYHLFRDYRDLDRRAWAGFVPREFCTGVDEMHGLLGGTEADSSCVVLDKARAWDALLATMAMNGPLQPFTYARLNGDKDTWALAAAVTRQNFSTSATTPGYFMEEAEPGLTLLDAAYAGRAHPLRGHVQFRRAPEAPGGVEPLYLNNQLLNMTEYPRVRPRLAFGLWEDYGYPFCGWRAVNPLLRPPARVFEVLDAVAPALREVGAPDECLCKWFRCRYPDLSTFI